MSKVRSDNISNRADDGAPALVYGVEVPVGYGITGAGGINITGIATATSFSGTLTGNVTGNVTGAAATFNNVVKVGTAITMDATSGIVTATSFVGDGSSLTNAGASAAKSSAIALFLGR